MGIAVDLCITFLEVIAFVLFISRYSYRPIKNGKCLLSIAVCTAAVHLCTSFLPQDISPFISLLILAVVLHSILDVNIKSILIGYFTVVIVIVLSNIFGFYLASKLFNHITLAQMRRNYPTFAVLILPELFMLPVLIVFSKQVIIVLNNTLCNRKTILYLCLVMELFLFTVMTKTKVSFVSSLLYEGAFIGLIVYSIIYFMKCFSPNNERDLYLSQIQGLRRYIQKRQRDDSQILSILYANIELGKVNEAKDQLALLLEKRSGVDLEVVMGTESSAFMMGFAKLFVQDTKIIINERVPLSFLQADSAEILRLFRTITDCVYGYKVEILKITTLDYYDMVLIVIGVQTTEKVYSLELSDVNTRIVEMNGNIEITIRKNIIKFNLKIPRLILHKTNQVVASKSVYYN